MRAEVLQQTIQDYFNDPKTNNILLSHISKKKLLDLIASKNLTDEEIILLRLLHKHAINMEVGTKVKKAKPKMEVVTDSSGKSYYKIGGKRKSARRGKSARRRKSARRGKSARRR